MEEGMNEKIDRRLEIGKEGEREVKDCRITGGR